jgi:myo-inositol 2-dehydrogenase/D-chiro-inositol 1-dehydrogenase
MTATLRVGILGCGRIGQIHSKSVVASPRMTLVAVADALPEAARALALTTGAEARTAEAILSASDIDAIVIGTPTDTHAGFIENAAATGKAVLCEKPVDLSSDRIRLCLAAVEPTGTSVMVGLNRRFDPDFAELKRRLSADEIGAIEILSIISRDSASPPLGYIQHSGGLFRDMMIHDFDMARFLLGDEPIRVFALGACLVDAEIGRAGDVDTAAVILTTASGRIVQISNSRRAAYGFDQRIEVHGARGMLTVGNTHLTRVVTATAAGFVQDTTLAFFPERYAASYQREMESFADAVTSSTAPSPSLRDGLAAQLLADAATQSAQTGSPVDLSID